MADCRAMQAGASRLRIQTTAAQHQTALVAQMTPLAPRQWCCAASDMPTGRAAINVEEQQQCHWRALAEEQLSADQPLLPAPAGK
jgi:hypothetical protein